MEKEEEFSSKNALKFYFVFFGGLGYLVLGIFIFIFIYLKLYNLGWVSQEPGAKARYLILVVIALYLSVTNLWIFVSSFWLRKKESFEKGVWTSWILSLFSFNFISSIGALMGALELIDGEEAPEVLDRKKDFEVKNIKLKSLSDGNDIRILDNSLR